MFINTSAMLHVFEFSPPLDERGKEIIITPRQVDCVIS